jgi:Uma2 family endonuclease
MPTVIVDDVNLESPEWVTSRNAFHRWAAEPDFPEKGNIWWLRGKVWADLSMEQIDTHIQVKGEIFRVLANLVVEADSGQMLQDGLRVTNADADLSGKPDATFISYESLRQGRVVRVEGQSEGHTYVEGSPDMVLEVVSNSSETKDLEILREDYFIAGVTEYWLVDAREDLIQFDILRRNSKEFIVTRKQSGWVKSAVFGKSFRLIQKKDRLGNPQYRLEAK